MIARLICRFRGHVTLFFNFTATIPGVTVVSECRRCHGLVEQAVWPAVRSGTHLRLVKPEDAA